MLLASTDATVDVECGDVQNASVNVSGQALFSAVVVLAVCTETRYDHESLLALSLLWHYCLTGDRPWHFYLTWN